MSKKPFSETQLAALAKKLRIKSGKTRAGTARDLGVSQTSIFHAEESPKLSLFRLRKQMIELYSGKRLVGPLYFLKSRS